MQHEFILRHRSCHIILDLIARTKKAVREFDNLNYRKMKKILLYETESQQGDVEGEVAVFFFIELELGNWKCHCGHTASAIYV